jgi:hypothetical protein
MTLLSGGKAEQRKQSPIAMNTSNLISGNTMEENHTAIGYSNGQAYPLLNYDLETNHGLIELPEWIWPVWCLFEEIVLKPIN